MDDKPNPQRTQGSHPNESGGSRERPKSLAPDPEPTGRTRDSLLAAGAPRPGPRTWSFWREALMCLFACSMAGHALEIPYCALMGSLFGIVGDGYAAMVDPWYVPYWAYGMGAVVASLAMEPAKARLLRACRTVRGALGASFALAVGLCAALETGIGLAINRPDHLGEYPYWDNSELPLNVLGQGWLVNDVLLGAVATAFVWVALPLFRRGVESLGRRLANGLFGASAAACAACCALSYGLPALA